MTKKILVKGDDKVVNKIKQENRVRVRKGQVTITPADGNVEGVSTEQFEALQSQVETLAQQVADLTAQISAQGSGSGEGSQGAGEGDNTETNGEGDNTESPGEGGE